MRDPKVANKYNLKPRDIQRAVILDHDRLTQPPFWRNDIVKAWCLSGGAGHGLYGYVDSYWIGFYDDEVEMGVGLNCTSYEDMCGYSFEQFYNPEEMENEIDLELQEKLLERINWLIDEGIIMIH